MKSPLCLVDVVIFTVIDERLHVLLVRRADAPFKGALALPGGFIDVERDGSLRVCAMRKLREKTGLESSYLEQLGSWGGPDRDPRGWSTSTVYFALVAAQRLTAGGNASDTTWAPIVRNGVAGKLAFDHAEILEAAVKRLRSKVEYTSLPAFLLPAEFTLTELQHAYEIVLGRTLEKSAFRTRMLSAKLVTETGRQKVAASRPAQLYRLRSPTKPVLFPRTFRAR